MESLKINKDLKIVMVTLILTIMAAVFGEIAVFIISKTGIKLSNTSLIITVILEISILIIPCIVVKKYNKGIFNIELIGMKNNGNKIKQLLIGLGAGLLMFGTYKLILLVMGIERYKGIGFEFYSTNKVLISIISAFTVAIIGGVCEEVFFRGVLLKYLANYEGESFALIVSSIIFTIFHITYYQNFIQFAEILILGIALGYCYILTKSIYLSIALHFAWNFYNSLTSVNTTGLLVFTLNNKLSIDYCNNIIMIAQSIIEIIVALILIFIDITRKDNINNIEN